jgi:hypothetical protein
MKFLSITTNKSVPGISLFAAIVNSFGITALIVTLCPVVNATELPQSRWNQIFNESVENTSQDMSIKTGDSIRQSVNSSKTPKKSPAANTQGADQVAVTDIPAECQSYFPSEGTVSLFDYQEGLERCRDGD